MFDLLNEFFKLMCDSNIDLIRREYCFNDDSPEFQLSTMSHIFKMQSLLYNDQKNLMTTVAFISPLTGSKTEYSFEYKDGKYFSEDEQIIYCVESGKFEKENVSSAAKEETISEDKCQNKCKAKEVKCNDCGGAGIDARNFAARDIYEKLNKPHVSVDADNYIIDIIRRMIDDEMYAVVKNHKNGKYEKIAFSLNKIKEYDESGVLGKCSDGYFMSNVSLFKAMCDVFGFTYCAPRNRKGEMFFYCGLVEREENKNE